MSTRIEPDQVRDGLFLAASRTYAEQYVEPFIRRKFDLLEPDGNDHDAIDRSGRRYEIKASKVMRRRKNSKKTRPLLDRVYFEVHSSPLKRYFDASQRFDEDYLANIQNVKRDHFDFLIYVLLFRDGVWVFQAPRDAIAKGKFLNWSDKHGRYDAEGKSGQFPINRLSIQWHEDHCLHCVMDYREVGMLMALEAPQ